MRLYLSTFLLLLMPTVALGDVGNLPPELSNAGTLYRLDAEALYQDICFGPCPCPPPTEALTIRGIFTLGPAMPGNVVDFHRVSQLQWTTYRGGVTVNRISGDGVYKVTNYGSAQQQSLELNLSIDGADRVYFFSDFTDLISNDARIDIQVSKNGLYCHDTVIRVAASMVPMAEIIPYRLIEGSTYQQGCFDPCDCLLEEPRPMIGGFALLPLFDAGTYAEFVLLGARFAVPGTAVADPSLWLRGRGRYILIQGFAGPIHAMGLSLSLNGTTPLRYDQELDNSPAFFPGIDISVDMNDQVCFDRILTLKARPSN